MMQWVLAAIRPLVLTMVFCGLGVFTSCTNSDNPQPDFADYQNKLLEYRQATGQ